MAITIHTPDQICALCGCVSSGSNGSPEYDQCPLQKGMDIQQKKDRDIIRRLNERISKLEETILSITRIYK